MSDGPLSWESLFGGGTIGDGDFDPDGDGYRLPPLLLLRRPFYFPISIKVKSARTLVSIFYFAIMPDKALLTGVASATNMFGFDLEGLGVIVAAASPSPLILLSEVVTSY